MKKAIIILSSILMLMFTACTKEDTFIQDGRPMGEVTFTSTIIPMSEPSTKAAVNHFTDGKVTFQTGDRISLFVTPEGGTSVKYTATFSGDDSHAWTIDGDPLTWDRLGARTTFTAFWPPVNEAPGEEHVHHVKNQKWNNSVKESDILVATTTVKGGEVVLEFKHAVSLVQVTIHPTPEVKLADITNGTVHVKSCNGVSVNTVTGKITPADGDVQEVMMNNGQGRNTTFSALVCPHAIREDWHENGWLRISVGSTATYDAPRILSSNGRPFTALEAGQAVSIRLTPGNKENSAELDDIYRRTRWAHGIEKPVTLSKWGYADAISKLYGYTWTEGCGWYDCKKYNPDNTITDPSPLMADSFMCWAATTSNMLHWWFDRNREYITRFGYSGPSPDYPNSLHSEIFNHFKRAFQDAGGWMKSACHWFINESRTPGGYDSPEVANTISRGFFKEVFDEAATDEIVLEVYDARQVGEYLKKAYPVHETEDNFYTVGFATYKGQHAMTIWGAAFDDVTGDPTHVFMCDNNMRNWEYLIDNVGDIFNPPYRPGVGVNVAGKEVRAGMALRRVRKGEGGFWEIEMSNGWDRFWGITLLNPGTRYWEDFFAKHPERDLAVRPSDI